jgi:hypothetical protein
VTYLVDYFDYNLFGIKLVNALSRRRRCIFFLRANEDIHVKEEMPLNYNTVKGCLYCCSRLPEIGY